MKKKKIFILTAIIIVAIVVCMSTMLFLTKNNKISLIENIKNKIAQLGENIQNTNETTIVDITNLVKGKETEHEHLLKTMYDETNHWEECTVCGEKQTIETHSYTTTWALGYESCDYRDSYTKTCSCGYSYVGYKPCVWNGSSYITMSDHTHTKKCTVCGMYIFHSYYFNGNLYSETDYYEKCKLSNGLILDCTRAGNCAKCKGYFSSGNHNLNTNRDTGIIACAICNKEFGKCEQSVTVDSNTPPIYKVITNVNLTNGATYYSINKICNELMYQTRNHQISNKNSAGTSFTITDTVRMKNTVKYSIELDSRVYVKIGSAINISCGLKNPKISPDLVKPIISRIVMDNQEELTEWSRTKPIIIKGTENYCNTVKVKILDDGENIVFEGETSVINGEYSISCTPEIEAGLTGRTFKAIVTDACENTTEQDFIVAKVDSISPKAISGNEILGDWAKSKEFTFAATDKGIGNVSIAFNDVKDYRLATNVENNTYSRKYKFIGDAYVPTEAVVFYKDGLGNVSTQTVTLDKIDNTAPTITSASIDRNVITITANDEHPDLGEGSGVVSYRYLISDTKIENPVITEENSILVSDKTTGTGTFTIDNLYNNQYVYVAVVDLVGNIGEAKEIFEPISYTIKYNGNGATSGNVEDSIHKYDESKNLNLDEYERKYTVTYNHNYENTENVQKQITYKFKNWNTKEEGTGTSYEDREEVINLTNKAGEVINLYAMWETDSISYEPTREGYSFGGWYLDAECTKKVANVEYIPTEDVTLYAKWEKEYTITVDNDRDGHTYNSYQVFKGDYYEKEEKVLDKEGNPVLDENGEEKVVKIPILSNIEWGEELQKEVTTENNEDKEKPHGDKIIELLKQSENSKLDEEKLYTNCETAEDVAKVLQGKPNDGDVIRNFTDVVGKYILDNNIEITKGTYTLVEEKDEAGNVVEENYKIQYLKPGYYLVIDAKANDKDDAYSRYLIDVVQDVTMEPKSTKPTLSKKVKGNNLKTKIEGTGTSEENPAQYIIDEKRNTATYKETSEIYNAKDYDIQFELKSNIPDPDRYSTYKLEIVDILAKGFDYDRDSVKVFLGEKEYPKQREKVIKGNEEKGEEDKTETVENYTIKDVVITAENYVDYQKYFEEEGKEYSEEYKESQYGKTLILIEINDLIGQINDKVVKLGQDVFVRYNSKLNGKGEVGNIPNINEAYLKYSNNPYNNDQITQTTIQTTYTYTIDLELSKIAEIRKTEDNSNSIENQDTVEDLEIQEQLKCLSGAVFEIYDGLEYIEDSLIPTKNPNRKLIGRVTTDELGKGLYSSLGTGTYYLKEVKSPEGYNKLREEIEIEITATCDELGAITWNAREKNKNDLVLVQMGAKESGEGENKISIPIVKLQVENKSGFELPVTGGIGTIRFTIIGLILMIAVIIILKQNKNY